MSGKLHTKTYKAFLKKLIAFRKGRGLSQETIAQRLSKPQSWVSKTERGERRIDPVELCELAKALGCEPEELLDMAKPETGRNNS